MSFEVMPELDWLIGYPFALGLMVLSAVGSFGLFERRGWL
jgi:magnesium transporter